MTIGTTGLGRKAAIGYANLRREGKTLEQIGRMFGCTKENIRLALQRGCPAFVVPPATPLPAPVLAFPEQMNLRAPTVRQRVEKRPDWSYPDEITLQIVREARAEMEGAGA